MHAIKNADGQADLAAARLQFICGVDEIHGKIVAASRQSAALFLAVLYRAAATGSASGGEF
jgi:hypothetical protein